MTYILKTKDGERTAESPEGVADLLMQGRDLRELASICAEWEIAMDAENKDGCVADMLAQSFLGHGRSLRDELALIIECQAEYGPGFNGADFEVVWRKEEVGMTLCSECRYLEDLGPCDREECMMQYVMTLEDCIKADHGACPHWERKGAM